MCLLETSLSLLRGLRLCVVVYVYRCSVVIRYIDYLWELFRSCETAVVNFMLVRQKIGPAALICSNATAGHRVFLLPLAGTPTDLPYNNV